VTGARGIVLPALFTRHHVFLRATIGGAPALLLFDSGASATIFSPRLVRRLGLAYRGRHLAFGIGEPVTGASRYEGTEIGFGSLRIRPSTVLAWSDAGFPTYGQDVPDGVIGYDLLRSFVVVVDIHAERVVAYDSSAAPQAIRSDGQAIPLRVTSGLPVVQIDVFAGGHPTLSPAPLTSSLSVVVDFGAGAGVQLSRVASERLGFPARLRDARMRQLVGIGGAVELPEGVTDSVRIAGAAIPRAIVAADTSALSSVALADADGFIGTEVLRRFIVTLDYPRGRAVFEPNTALRAPFCRNTAGLCVRPQNALKAAEVFFVDPGSPGARAGIRPGNFILAVDGTSVALFSTVDVDRLLDRGPGALLEVARSASQLRSPPREVTSQRGLRRPVPQERVGELVRLPNP
jgi:membrane-associated protease RseP (regulator of RpoE activity)